MILGKIKMLSFYNDPDYGRKWEKGFRLRSVSMQM